MPPIATEKRFRRDLHKKPAALQGTILATVKRLGENPRHPSLRSKQVQGTTAPKVFEASVDMRNRITWHWEDGVIVLRNHCNHDILKKRP
jgi:hypothetical protein